MDKNFNEKIDFDQEDFELISKEYEAALKCNHIMLDNLKKKREIFNKVTSYY